MFALFLPKCTISLMSKEKRPAVAIGGLILLLIIGAVAAVLISTGTREGSIELYIPEVGSTVYFENDEKSTTETPDELFSAKNLRRKTYSLVVGKEGYWPWAKDVDISEDNQHVVLESWNLPTVIPQIEVPRTSPDYGSTWAQINNHPLPSEGRPLLSGEGNVAVWVREDNIFAEWRGSEEEIPYYFCESGTCDERLAVLTTTSNIDSISFYKDREDVIVFSNGEGIYAIEINRRGTQNFQPILQTDRSVKFYTADGSTFYIVEGALVSKITL